MKADQAKAIGWDTRVQNERPATTRFLCPGKNLADIDSANLILVRGTPGVVEVDAVGRLIKLPRLITRVDWRGLHEPTLSGRPARRSDPPRLPSNHEGC